MELTPSHLRTLANRFGYQAWTSTATVDGVYPVIVDMTVQATTYVFTEAQLAEFAKAVVSVARCPDPAHGAPREVWEKLDAMGYRPVA